MERDKPLSERCSAMQIKIHELEWVQRTLKTLPNLPKGRLRDSLEDGCRAIVDDGHTSPLSGEGVKHNQTGSTYNQLNGIKKTLVKLSSPSGLSQPQVNKVIDCIDNLVKLDGRSQTEEPPIIP